MFRFLSALVLAFGLAGMVKADANGQRWTEEDGQKGVFSPPLTCHYEFDNKAPRYVVLSMVVVKTNALLGDVVVAGDAMTFDTWDPDQADMNWGTYTSLEPGIYYAEIYTTTGSARLNFTITAPAPKK